MRITVKRKDSVASILLFIFNVFLVERGIHTIPLKKIFQLLEPFQKNETAIRMGLSREVHNRLLVNQRRNNEVYYCLTEEAMAGFKHWMKVMDFTREKAWLQQQEWSGDWSFLLLGSQLGVPQIDLPDIGHSNNNPRNSTSPMEIQSKNECPDNNLQEFIETIIEFGFGNINKSLWVSPYNWHERFSHLISGQEPGSQIYVFTSRFVSIGNQTKDASDLAAKIWPVKNLSKRYQDFLSTLSKSMQEFDSNSNPNGHGLPFLYRAGLDFFEIAQDDPHLPLKLLPPDWPGIEAAMAFQKWRQKLLPEANQFIDRVLSET